MSSPKRARGGPLGASKPQKRRAWLRWLKAALWLLGGLELCYLLGANLFLNCGLLPLAFAGTNQVTATVGAGFSVIPGRVHARNVRVTFQDHNLQFALEAERVFVVIHLSELVHRRFHGSHLRGEGLSFRLRHRIDPWSQHEPSVAEFAPIPEFRAPAVFEAYVPEAPIPDAKYALWAVHFDDVDIGLTEAWVQAFRYRGKGRARGQFELKPARRLWVGPASLELGPGLLSAGAYRVAPGLHGRIECTVHPFDVRVPEGMAVFRYLSAHVALASPELDPRVVALLAPGLGLEASSTGGSLFVDAAIAHGVLTPQSRLELTQRGVLVRSRELELGAERLSLTAGADGESASAATLVVDQGTIQERVPLAHPPELLRLSLTAVSSNRDVARDFDFQEARLNEVRLSIADGHFLNRWLASKAFEWSGGGLSLLAHGRYADSLLDGEARVETNGVAARFGAARARAAGTLSLRVTGADPRQLRGAVAAELTLRALRAELGRGVLDLGGLRAEVSARRGSAGSALHGRAWLTALASRVPGFTFSAPQLNASADSDEGSAKALVTHFVATIPALIAEGRGARLTTGAQARGTFAQPKEKGEAARLELEATLLQPALRVGARGQRSALAPRVDLHAALTRDAQGALDGKVTLDPAAWHIDADSRRFAGRTGLELELEAFDSARHSGVVRGRLAASGVTVGDTTQNADCAWSRVQALELLGTAKLLPRGTTSLSLNGELGQVELSWGDFTTHADIGVSARFEQGLLEQAAEGTVDLSFRRAAIQSGGGGKLGWSASAPAIDVSGRLSRTAGQLVGTAEVSAKEAQGRIGATRLITDLQASFKIDSLDLRQRTLHAAGSVHVRNLTLPRASLPVSKWWADVQVDSLYGHAEQNLELGGTFRAELRDATPGLSVLASEGSLPGWIQSVFPLRGLTVTGSMARRCRLTDIHLVEVHGGPAVARGRLQSVPDGFQGALLLRLAGLQAISAGLDFDANHTHVGLFDGDAWLLRFNKSFDRQADDAVKLACPPDPNTCGEGVGGTVQASSAE